LVVGHHDDRSDAEGVPDERQADPRIAGRSFDDRPTRLQHAALHEILDDPAGRPVLDRAAGVHEFGFAQNFAAGQFRQPPQAQQGRAADVAFNSTIGPCRRARLATTLHLIQFTFRRLRREARRNIA